VLVAGSWPLTLRQVDAHLQLLGSLIVELCGGSCCILRGPGGELIVDIVSEGTELELQLRRGVGQAAHTRNNPHVKCTGGY